MMKLSAVVLGLLIVSPLWARSDAVIDELLARQDPPPGVVFDIDEWDNDALQWAVPLIRNYTDRLRSRFPDLEIAVVSHGEEEFALMKNAREQFPTVHREIEELVSDQVPVHVCAGHAVMSGYSENQFVDFVDRVSAGVETVADYRRRGFVHVPVQQPR